MKKIMAVNCGSSSLKFKLFEMPEEQVICSGIVERIGHEDGIFQLKYNDKKDKVIVPVKDHGVAVKIVLDALLKEHIISSYDEIKATGHRVVQGGPYFSKSELFNEDTYNKIESLIPLAPLHNAAHLTGYRAFKEVLPNTPHIAVFDTAFHQTMEEEVYLYPVPYEWYTKYAVRRYGAHGTSHKYVSMRANEILENPNARLITCHIGNGASISAVKAGKCVETSMGLTPNAGLMMGTRCGDIDATILPYIMEETGMTPKEMDTALNKQSGLFGISGVSSDSRDIEDGINNGDERCILAQKMYVKRIVDFIAKYYVELGGCDAIIFTAGVGENSISTRMEVMEKLACLGVKPDAQRNNVRGKETLISADNSKIPVYIIPTNEELMIATDTYNLAK